MQLIVSHLNFVRRCSLLPLKINSAMHSGISIIYIYFFYYCQGMYEWYHVSRCSLVVVVYECTATRSFPLVFPCISVHHSCAIGDAEIKIISPAFSPWRMTIDMQGSSFMKVWGDLTLFDKCLTCRLGFFPSYLYLGDSFYFIILFRPWVGFVKSVL